MMELLKKHIHMNRRRGNVTSQMTLDDDFNVPDSMDDVEELIMENGEVKIDSDLPRRRSPGQPSIRSSSGMMNIFSWVTTVNQVKTAGFPALEI